MSGSRSSQNSARHSAPIKMTIDPKNLTRESTKVLMALLMNNPDEVFSANTEYPVELVDDKKQKQQFVVKLTNNIYARQDGDQINYEVAEQPADMGTHVNYKLAGIIRIERDNLIYIPIRNTMVAETKKFDIFHLSHNDNQFLSYTLLHLHRNANYSFINKDVMRVITKDEKTKKEYVLYLKTNNMLLVRPREHNNEEYRVEAMTVKLGNGASAHVYSASTFAFNADNLLYHKRDDRIVKLESVKDESESTAAFEHEIGNLLPDSGSKTPISFTHDKNLCVARVEHRAPGDNLEKILKNPDDLTTDDRLWITKYLIVFLSLVHRLGYRHLDIKPENIIALLQPPKHATARLIDFGLALTQKMINEGCLAGGSPIYQAPEVFYKAKPGLESDIYSLGVTLGDLWGAQLCIDPKAKTTEEKIEAVKKLSLNYKFSKLFSCKHDLSDQHKQLLEAVFKAMVVPRMQDRVPLTRAFEIVDKVMLERKTQNLPHNSKISITQVHEIALKIKTHLESQDHLPLKTLTESTKELKLLYLTLNGYNLASLPDAHINEFIETLGAELFAGQKSFRHINNLIAALFAHFTENVNHFSRVKAVVNDLNLYLEQANLEIDFAEATKELLKPFSVTACRMDTLRVTLDNLAKFNRKYNRAELDAMTLRIGEFTLKIKEHITLLKTFETINAGIDKYTSYILLNCPKKYDYFNEKVKAMLSEANKSRREAFEGLSLENLEARLSKMRKAVTGLGISFNTLQNEMDSMIKKTGAVSVGQTSAALFAGNKTIPANTAKAATKPAYQY